VGRRFGAALAALLIVPSLIACGASQIGPAPAASKPSSSASATDGKGRPFQAADYPEAPQSLVFTGDVTANVSVGRPTSCGSGVGSGSLFAFGLLFRAGDQWISFDAYTNPAVKQYTKPGKYAAIARMGAVGPDGPGAPKYQGDITLTVTKESFDSPDTGTVSGRRSDGGAGVETVSGGWTCVRSPQLGPG
jgi:hypothetical protein